MKPHTDEERRTELRLLQLKGEQGRLQHERDRLRQQLMGALFLGPSWEGPPPQELNERIAAVTRQWNAIISRIREIYDAGRPPSALPPSQQSFVLGGQQKVGVPMVRVR